MPASKKPYRFERVYHIILKGKVTLTRIQITSGKVWLGQY